MLEKLPGVASADADKTTSSATIVYDKSIFDTSSIPEGRYTFELRQDSAAEEGTAGGSDSSNEETEANSSSMIKIEDAPAEGRPGKSEENDDDSLMPSLDGPSS